MEAAAAAEQQKQQVQIQQQQQQQQISNEHLKTNTAATTKPQVVIKHRRRRRQKMNGDTLGDLQIDVKRPNSVLVDTSIRALLTNFAFSQLSPENQKILVESLPLVDRPVVASDNEAIELNPSSINNEFFNRACIEWRDRLAYGEFTNEHQTKLKAEQERDKSKIDPWKARNFEGIWGIKATIKENLGQILEKSAMEVKGRMEQDDFDIPVGFINEMWKTEEDVKQEQQTIHVNQQAECAEQQEDVKEEETYEEENEEEHEAEEEMEATNLNTVTMSSPSQNPSVSTSVPTPPETVTSTQPDTGDSPPRKSPSPQIIPVSTPSKSPDMQSHQPIIAEATSSADDVPTILQMDSPEPSTSNFIADDDDDIASHVELSSDGMPTQWYHQQEHDYLKNIPEMEPESSGMDMDTVGDIVDDTAGIELIENDNAIENVISENFQSSPEPEPQPEIQEQVTPQQQIITTPNTVTRITNYDAELPQEIFHKSEPQQISGAASATFSPNSGMLINNFVQQEEQSPVVVMAEPSPQFNQVVVQEEQNEAHFTDTYMMDETEIDSGNAFHEEIRVTMPKNVKLVAFPSGVNYIKNDNYIIEEQPQHIPQQTTSTATFRANGANIQPIQNSYFVGGGNTFTYISDMGNKIETNEPTTRIMKQESSTPQPQPMKQRIIYEISTEPKVSYDQPAHHVTYTTPPQPEIFHKMVNHNGTTTIYTESAGPPQKKTIIQRKKPNDPYTVQVALQSVTNNNTFILRPIGSTGTQQIQQQPQKSIVHIHRAPQIVHATSQPVQYFATASPQTFLKKQTVIIPQMAPSTAIKAQPKYTTVIRAPVAPQVIAAPQPQQTQITTQQVASGTVTKIQRPIQKQKVIMSTSSLQHYRSFNQKPNVHGSRKQLHPQHIIRPAPSATTTVIHHSMATEAKGSQIPVILPSNGVSMAESFTHQIPTNQVVSASPTVVTINSAPTKNIFVRQNRPPQQIFQTQHNQQIFTTTQPTQSTILQQQQQPTILQPQPQPTIIQQQTQQTIIQQQAPPQQQPQFQGQAISLQPRMRNQNSHRPPPGTVNLERSYQICQAVIQNSPNRHQLNCQLKPPPTSLLGGSGIGQKKF